MHLSMSLRAYDMCGWNSVQPDITIIDHIVRLNWYISLGLANRTYQVPRPPLLTERYRPPRSLPPV